MQKLARIGTILALVGLGLLLPGLASTVGATDAKTDAPLALKGFDPVLLTQGEEKAGEEAHSLVHGRFLYRFVSAESQARFAADPERYSIQGDGQCAVMPSARALPSLFAVHEGRIYGFGSPGCRADFLANPDAFTKKEESAARTVGIVVFDGVELLDFAGPGEVFAAAGHGRIFDVFTLGVTTAPIMSQGFVRITPERAMGDGPRPDILVIPGGGVSPLMNSPEAMAWIRETAEDAIVLSVCNGALVLAEAGLLEGKEATTHHGSLASLRRLAPNTVVHADRRFVDNGRVITAAGVSAGIDAALHLVSRLQGTATAESTAAYMEYDWRTETEGVRRASAGSR